MKKKSILLIFPILLTASFAVSLPQREKEEPFPVPKEITLQQTDSETPDEREFSDPVTDVPDVMTKPFVEIDPKFVLVHTQLFNLDLDQVDEQIIILKPREDPNSRVHLAVIDFDTISNRYIVAWQGDTSAVNIRTFVINFDDIVGDHNLEIICYGTNENSERTLDIFRRTPSPQGLGIFYSSICSISADGSIEIKKHERTQAYKLGQKNGLSYPIIALSRDKDSDNFMDLVKYEYYWKYQDNRYIRGRSEKIPGSDIAEQQLQTLFAGTLTDLEYFLTDPWFKTDAEETAEERDTPFQELIVFDRDQDEIIFFSGDVQEIYEWESSQQTRIPNSIYVYGVNQLVPFIEKRILIYISSPDTIEIQVNDRDFQKSNYDWDGTYRRFGSGLQKVVLSSARTEAPHIPDHLDGLYKDSEGNSLYFEESRVAVKKGADEYRAVYSLFTVGNSILELKEINQSNRVLNKKVYRFNHSVQENEDLRIYTLILEEGELNVHGFESLNKAPWVLQKFEFLESEESSMEADADGNGQKGSVS